MAAKQIVCDTDVMIDYLDSKHNRHVQTKGIIENAIGIENVVLTGITQMELLLGALNKNDLFKIKKSTTRFTTILVNQKINMSASHLIEKYALSHGLALPDSLISATAIEANLQLFTYNTKDYKFITELSLFKF